MKVHFFIKHSVLVIVIAGLLTNNLYVGIFHSLIFLIITYILQLIQKYFKPNHLNIVKKYIFLIMILSVWGLNIVLNSFQVYREMVVLNPHVINMTYVSHYQEETVDGNLYALYESKISGQYLSAIKLQRSMTGNYIANWSDVTQFSNDGSIVVLIDYDAKVIIVFRSKNSPIEQIEFKQTNGDKFIVNLKGFTSEFYTLTYHFSDIDYNGLNSPKFIEKQSENH